MVHSATSGSNGSSDCDGNNEGSPELNVGGSFELNISDCPQHYVAPPTTDDAVTLSDPASPCSPQNEHALDTGMMDVGYVCRILEEPQASSDKHVGLP